MDRTLGAKFSSRSVELFWCSFKLLLACLQKTRSCPALVVSCPEFDVAHSRANCRSNNGDFLSLGKQRLQRHYPLVIVTLFLSRFCQNTGPSNYRSRASKLILEFRSNKRVHGRGAECTIACSDFTPTIPVPCVLEGSVHNSNVKRSKL